MGARESTFRAPGATSAKYSGAENRSQRNRETTFHARGDVAASRESGLCWLPCPHGPDRVRDGKLRCGGTLARYGCRERHRYLWRFSGWHQVRRHVRTQAGAGRASRAICFHDCGKAADVRVGAESAVLRCPRGSRDCAFGGGEELFLRGSCRRCREEPGVSAASEFEVILWACSSPGKLFRAGHSSAG